MSSEDKTAPENVRSAEQIEIDIARTRAALTATVDELSSRLDPKTLVSNATGQAKVKATAFASTAKDTATTYAEASADIAKDFAARAKEMVEEAKSGDQRALALLAGATVAAAGVLALVVRQIRK